MNRNDIYNHAYLVLNICMVVKIKDLVWTRSEKILKDQNGILYTSNLTKLGIPGPTW
jgi:hypothetical protein